MGWGVSARGFVMVPAQGTQDLTLGIISPYGHLKGFYFRVICRRVVYSFKLFKKKQNYFFFSFS